MTTQNIQGSYAAGLESHLSGAGESGLHDAYQFGRQAMVDGLSLLDITMLHHEVLSIMLPRWRPEEQAARILRAAEFLAEALSPFEMALRGWHDTAARHRQANGEPSARAAPPAASQSQLFESLPPHSRGRG
jgi:hypothetical protein